MRVLRQFRLIFVNKKNRMTVQAIFFQFLKLGFIAFGGPAAHAALMERELVSRKGLLKPQVFLDYIGAVNLIPGPNSTQLCMLVGYKLRGFWGMVAGGMGFVLPAALITGVFAWLYVRLGHVPAVESLFFGIKPAVIAIIVSAIFKLGRKALKTYWLGVLGLITLVATLFGLNEITAILGAGATGMAVYAIRSGFTGWRSTKSVAPFVLLQVLGQGIAGYSSLKLFWIFFKIGAVLFGTGYVLVAYMDGELVEKAGWITREQLLDAIAIGQFTPGPILSAATFVGYLLEGWKGAALATAGIFLPSFAFIMILYPIIPKLRKSPFTAAFLDAVNVGAVAVMLAVSITMTIEVAVNPIAAAIMALALLAVFGQKKFGSIWIIAAGALLGFVLGVLGLI